MSNMRVVEEFKMSTIAFVLMFSMAVLAGYWNPAYCKDPYFNGRYELWFSPRAVKPYQDDLLLTTLISTGPGFSNTINTTLNSDWCFGFNLGGAISSSCAPWSFQLDYTHWYNNPSSTVTAVSGAVGTTILNPILGRSINLTTPAGSVGRVATSVQYYYNLFDVTAAWSGCFCQNLVISPYGGFRGFWYKTKTEQINSASNGVTNSPGGDPTNLTNDYQAYGVVGGLGFDYLLWRCFNLYGSFGGSIVAGPYSFDYLGIFNGTGSQSGTSSFNGKNILVNYSIEASLGVLYHKCICGLDTFIGLGYEPILWGTSIPDPLNDGFVVSSNNKRLVVQAITTTVGFSF